MGWWEISDCKKSVLDFDIDEDGNIVYTNGNYVIRILENGKEEKIEKITMGTKVRCKR